MLSWIENQKLLYSRIKKTPQQQTGTFYKSFDRFTFKG